MPHISNMYFLEEVISVRALRSAVASEFRSVPSDNSKVGCQTLRQRFLTRAVGKLFVAGAGALPVTVSDE
jgi:hypothetical protein